MRKLELSDLWPLPEYEKVREDFRRRMIELKKRRRVQVGPLLSFIFENRDTVLFQVQEMLRAEDITEPERAQEELDIYNTLLPEEGELSATLFIEVTDPDRLPDEMARLRGLDETVFLEIAGDHVPAVFEEGRATAEALSTVQYVRFRLSPAQAQTFRAEKGSVVLAVYHPNYRDRSIFPPETRQALGEDLGD
ncbi:MAG: DUF3501 family protein [Dehalococcoidia bacterium]|nr:DUF3501 family protein [Dehalococcoidia bacterium]